MKTQTLTKAALAALALVAGACAEQAAAPPPVAAASRPSETKVRATKVDNRDLNTAESEYQAQVDGDSKDVTAKINLGVIKERKWDLDGALKAYQEAVKADPKNLAAALSLARVLTAVGKGEMAEKFLLMSKKANGDLPEILNGLSSVARARKKYPEAIEYAKKVLLREQNNIDALNNIALVYLEQGKFDSAELYAQTAIKRAGEGKNLSSLYVTLGMIQYKKGEMQRALALFNKAIALDPNNGVARQNVGLIALAYRDYGLASSELEQAYGLGQTSKEVSAGRCYALEGLKKGLEAATCMNTLLTRMPPKDPETASLLFALGMIHMNVTRDRDAAIAAFKRYADVKENLSKTDRVFDLIKSLESQQSAAPKADEPAKPEDKAEPKPEEPEENKAKADAKPASVRKKTKRQTKGRV
ncbi:MAG: tetratricopeptide repeat protein [Deltaproteobacteria bacterium]|nr:tetratricopeptide repeat protein [Deltaproteobacteria bacterium]